MPPKKQFDEMVAGAFARNGLNTLLLDIKEGLGAIGADLKHIIRRQDEFSARQDAADESRSKMHAQIAGLSEQVALMDATIERIVPLVDSAEARYQQTVGERRLWTKGRVIVGGAFAATSGAAGMWHYWDAIRSALHLR